MSSSPSCSPTLSTSTSATASTKSSPEYISPVSDVCPSGLPRNHCELPKWNYDGSRTSEACERTASFLVLMIFRRMRSFSIFWRFSSPRAAFADVPTIKGIPVYSEFDRPANRRHPRELFTWASAAAPAALLFWMNMDPVSAEEVTTLSNSEKGKDAHYDVSLSRVDDGSVVSNVHTTKWRIFTDNGRDYFLQGKLEEAEKFFLSALEEAKEGFGERDPHVASASNNLAEFYRVTKALDKAEPLYSEAIKILEESFGPEDVRVGAALHNLGQFYFVQRKLEEAQKCYEVVFLFALLMH
ncbi:hypothetical protein MLD38_034652 [Melastoma candidum]|uniref:Uncharacterized protein n=1 Tax=Melastoma candidum TaxID=119954 RepID=A0ACB9MCG9_9MYRT|nr:hypothetical protein MLD38_034652 [Melastoma candidum]